MTKRLNFLARIRYAQLFVGAREDIVRGNYHEAMSRVDRMFKVYGTLVVPSDRAPIKANIMCGLVAWNLRNFDLVYSSCRTALDQIGSELSSIHNGSVINELRYLRGYCKNLIAFAESEGHISTNVDFGDLRELQLPDYDLEKVGDLVRRTFPIDDTSWWSRERSPESKAR